MATMGVGGEGSFRVVERTAVSSQESARRGDADRRGRDAVNDRAGADDILHRSEENQPILALALKRGLLTPEHLAECDRIRKRLQAVNSEYKPKPIVDFLLMKGYLDKADLDELRKECGGLPRSEKPVKEETFVSVSPPKEEEETTPEEYRLGELAVRAGLVSFAQVRECLDIQRKVREMGLETKRLDEVLIEKKYMTREQLEELRSKPVTERRRKLRTSDRLLGQYLIAEKHLTEAQLQRGIAIHEHDPKGRKLGEVLVDEGIITKDVLQDMIIRKAKKPPVKQIEGIEIGAKQGAGSTGAVFRGKHKTLGIPVAIKFFLPSLTREEAFRRRLERDFKILSNIRDTGIPRLLDMGEEDGVCYVVSTYVEGISLKALIEHCGRLREREAIRIGLELLRILEAARRAGLSHRAFSPQNVLLQADGTVAVTDWITPLTLSHSLRTGRPAGTKLAYLAPEMILGRRPDERSDLYSLGAVLYHAVTGRPPFGTASVLAVMALHTQEEAPSARSHNAEVSEDVDRLLRRLLSKEPERRPGSIEDCGREMQALLEKDPKPSKPVEFIPRRTVRYWRPRPKTSPARVVWRIAAGILFLVLGAWMLQNLRNPVPDVTADSRETAKAEAMSVPGQEKPGPDLTVEHLKRLREFKLAIGTENAAVLYARATKNADDFKGTGYRRIWLEERDRMIEVINSESERQWRRIREEAEGAAREGRFGDAQVALEKFPERLRYFKAGMPTAGERRRTGFLARLRERFRKSTALVALQIRRAMERGEYGKAEALLARMEQSGDREWVRALRLELFERWYREIAQEDPGLARDVVQTIRLEGEDIPELWALAGALIHAEER